MKKNLLVVMAALAIAGCSQNDLVEGIDNGGKNDKTEIGVNAFVGKASRATDIDNTSFNKFTVHSYITDNSYAGVGALGTAYMNGVNYTGKKGAWTTTDETKYYWPSITSEKKMQFFAYPTDLASEYELSDSNYPSFSFTVVPTAENQKDLVVAHAANQTSTDTNDGTLSLSFKHVLTKVNFSFVPADTEMKYTVNSISIANLYGGKATYTFDASKGKWTPTGTADVSYSYPITQAASLNDGETFYRLGNENASLMLMPQDVSGKVITINYTVATSTDFEVFNDSKTVTLPANSIWGIGQSIRYTLTLPTGVTEIKLDTDVANNWDENEDSQTAK